MAEQLEAVSEIEQVRGEMEKPAKNKPAKDIIGFGKKMNVAMNIMLAFLAL
ncbi:TPA_asm: carbohydrate ABC transporter permease, partial [Listeria monocytogenes]|nr:carbohydrate ABC transporter permease [Listeria monocytogenes]